MIIDEVNVRATNNDALMNPQPGDFWREMMFVPYFIVVKVESIERITILSCLGGPDSYTRKHEQNAKVDNGDGTWSFDYSKSMIVNRDWIETAVKYSSMDSYVADVSRSERNNKIVNEWIEHRTDILLKELHSLGAHASLYMLKREWE